MRIPDFPGFPDQQEWLEIGKIRPRFPDFMRGRPVDPACEHHGLARPGTETDGAQVEQDPVLTRALVEDENRLKSVLRNSRSFPSKGWPAGRTPFFLES